MHWTPINYGIVEEGLGIHKVSGLGDAALAQKACQYILESETAPQFMFVVFDDADHGGNEKNHGGWTDGERFVMFAAAGKNVVKGEIGDMAIRDVAAIVLHALGYEAPGTWTARSPCGSG